MQDEGVGSECSRKHHEPASGGARIYSIVKPCAATESS